MNVIEKKQTPVIELELLQSEASESTFFAYSSLIILAHDRRELVMKMYLKKNNQILESYVFEAADLISIDNFAGEFDMLLLDGSKLSLVQYLFKKLRGEVYVPQRPKQVFDVLSQQFPEVEVFELAGGKCFDVSRWMKYLKNEGEQMMQFKVNDDVLHIMDLGGGSYLVLGAGMHFKIFLQSQHVRLRELIQRLGVMFFECQYSRAVRR